MEYKVKDIRAYGNDSRGCERTESDILLAAVPVGKQTNFIDIFLSNEQAEKLIESLIEELYKNKTLERRNHKE